MAQVMLLGGKPLLVGGKVAMSIDCCCGSGSGACCTGGTCEIKTASDCANGGGNYLGDNTNCDDVDCTQGACCEDGDCSITTEAGCGGTYQGDGSTCDDVDCTQGACCEDGSCTIKAEADCSGDYLGGGSTCDDVDCTQGACCATDGTCSITDQETCTTSGSQYKGDGTTCDGVVCNTGACCKDGVCSQQTETDCVNSGGTFLAYGIPCTPDPCTACSSCAFLNPCDGLYYLTKIVIASGTVNGGGGFNVWDFQSTAVYTCEGGSVTCSGEGSGSFYILGNFQYHIHGCCDCPFGDTNLFFSIGGLAWYIDDSENCSPCPKEACSGPDEESCDFQQWNNVACPGSNVFNGQVSTFYSNPCLHSPP